MSEKSDFMTVPEFLRLYYKDLMPVYKNTTPKISVEYMTNIMRDLIPKMIDEGGIKYFTSPTASGKTQHILDWISKQDLTQTKIVVAQPRHDLISEFMERLYANYPYGEDAPIYRVYPHQYNEAQLMRLKLGLPSGIHDKERADVLRMLKNPDAKGLFIITHAMLVKIGGGEGVNYYFIDENIEGALIDRVDLTKDNLLALTPYLTEKHRQKIEETANSISTTELGTYIGARRLIDATNDMTEDAKKRYIENTKVERLIGGLFRLSSDDLFIRNFNDALILFKKSEFFTKMIDERCNVIMMTATPMSALLSTYYPDATKYISFFTVPLAQNKGRIIQYMGNTGARGLGNSRVPELVEYVKSKHKGEDLSQYTVLTFKGAEQLFRDAGFNIEENELFNGEDNLDKAPALHIANCAGLDKLKGKRIIIAGKYDDAQETYDNLYIMSNPNATARPTRTKQLVEANGKSFYMFLYTDPTLREIQLEKIRYYTSQAAGRARALREQDGYVEVFCDYPLEEADEYVAY